MELAGGTAIVTGAAAGAGRAIALRLAREGSDVVVADVDARGGEATVARIERAGGGAVVNVASTAGLGLAAYVSPEYGAAKAGLIRFTATLAPLRERFGVRVNCLVPDWIRTERAEAELAAMTPAERAAAPEPIPLDDVARAIVRLARDDALAGRVLVLRGGAPPELLDPR